MTAKWFREPRGSPLSTAWLFDLHPRERGRILAIHPSGSKYICDPIVTDTDEDWVVLVKDRFVWEPSFIDSKDDMVYWDMNGDVYDDDKFSSFKRTIRGTTYNLIVTDNEEWYDKFVAATLEAKRLNLTLKQDRIDLFEKYLPRKEDK